MREEFSAGVINSLKRGVNLVLHSSNSPRSSQSLGLLSTLPGRIRSETMDLMADKEQLDWMRRGVAAWNGWRKDNPETTPDLVEANLVRAELAGANLAGARLQRCNLTRAKLQGANLRRADLREARILEAELSTADLSGADLSRAQLTGSKLIQAKLPEANLHLAQMGVSNLREANLRNASLTGADLRESLLVSADLRGADLRDCLLLGTHLQGANLAGARGLAAEGLAVAHTDEHTVFPEEDSQAGEKGEISKSVYALLLSLRSDHSGEDQVEERQVFRFNAALKRLEALGHDVSELEVSESSLSRRVASWDETPGGEAFEMDPSRGVNGLLFRARLDRALASFQVVPEEEGKPGFVVFMGSKR